MEFIHSFNVSQDVSDPMETACTNTRDIIITGQKEVAIFSGDGLCKSKRSLEWDPNGRGVTMDSQGNIIVTANIRSSVKCTSCEGTVCKLKVARFLQYNCEDVGTNLFISTKCSSGRHSLGNVYLSQSQLDKVAICAVQSTADFHTVLCDTGNNCLYVFKHDKIVRIITRDPKTNNFQFPHVIASLSTGDIVVGDYLAKRIKIFSIEGKFLNEFGETIPGGIFPHGVAVDSRDRIIVADKDNHRVLTFDTIGYLLKTLISDTIEDDMDIRPASVSVKNSGNGDRLYVLLKGLPGTNFAQVRIYSLGTSGDQEDPLRKKPLDFQLEGSCNVGGATYVEAPPSYEEVTSDMSGSGN